MSDEESFVARWSRLKRETGKGKEADARTPLADEPQKSATTADAETGRSSCKSAETEDPPFDPAMLPSIDSIVAGTDIRSFLQSGVPAELTRAALRRAWTADPAIRDFIGIAENQWDFTDPTAIPGFGPLKAGDDVGQLVAQAMGRLSEATDAEPGDAAAATTDVSPAATPAHTATTQGPGMPHQIEHPTKSEKPAIGQSQIELAASQHDPPGKPASRRGHGGAMPK